MNFRDYVLNEATPKKDVESKELSDKQKQALDHAYQLLEDINAHTENKQINSFVSEKYGIDFNKEIYGRFYKGDIGKEGETIRWGIEPGIEKANSFLKRAGLSLVVKMRP